MSAVDYRIKLSLPGNSVALEPASVRSVGTALHWFSIRHGYVGSLSFLFADNDVKLYGLSFTHTRFDLVRVASGDRCLVDENVLAGVIAFDEAVPVLDNKPFNGS